MNSRTKYLSLSFVLALAMVVACITIFAAGASGAEQSAVPQSKLQIRLTDGTTAGPEAPMAQAEAVTEKTAGRSAAGKAAPAACYDGTGQATAACPGTPVGFNGKADRGNNAFVSRASAAPPVDTVTYTTNCALNTPGNPGNGMTCHVYEADAAGVPHEISNVYTLPIGVTPGYVVMLSHGDPTNTADQNNQANWSDVIVFGTTTIQMLSKGCDTANLLDLSCFPSVATVNGTIPHAYILEIQSGAGDRLVDYTTYTTGNNTYYFYSGAATCADPFPAMNSLVAWWPAEGNTAAGGLSSQDIVGNNNAFPMNGAGYAPGLVGNAFSVNGTNQYFTVPDNPALNFLGPFSIDFWIKTTSLSGTILQKADNLGGFWHGYTFYLDGSGNLVFWMEDTSGHVASNNPSTVKVNDGTFHHIFVTVGRGPSGVGHLYLDGVDVADFNTTGVNDITNTGPLRIGTDYTATNFFAGLIDELDLYHGVIFGADARAYIFLADHAGKCQVTDVAITKTATPSVAAGTDHGVTYTGTVTNNGPLIANGAVVNDTLPPSAFPTAASPPNVYWPTGSVNWPAGASISGVYPGFWSTFGLNSATLPVGFSGGFVVHFTPSCAIPNGTVLTNTATVASTTADYNTTNNAATATTTITHPLPIVTCPANVTGVANTTNFCAANNVTLSGATAVDGTHNAACPTPTITYNPLPSGKLQVGTNTIVSGPNLPVGINTITVTATDAAGQSTNAAPSQCTYTVTVVDTQKPTFDVCPSSPVYATAPTPPSTTGAATWSLHATDNCAVASYTCTSTPVNVFGGASGSPITTGTFAVASSPYTVSCTAADAATNVTASACTFTVNMYNTCLRDTVHNTRMQLNTATGAWYFQQCPGGPALAGIGAVSMAGACNVSVIQNTPSGLVLVKLNICGGGTTGEASVTIPGAGQFLVSSFTPSNNCSCTI